MTIDRKGQLTEIQIESRDILLRFAQESDLNDYFTFLHDPEMKRLTGSQIEFTRNEIAAWINKISVINNDRVDFMILLKRTNELLGEVVLNEIDSINRSANIRIGIQGTQHRGKGYGSEAMIQMLRYGFNTLKLHRIHLGVYTFNPRAIHVYEKIGFKREGLQRDALYIDGKFHDMITMAILEDEFRLLHEPLSS
ncbi:GNAT family N-acetyltransferase [Paenibacillus sp. XY044]|uniref:GNAT family N-acetyltransferase n=1 Tax=Paenibacillus sp. XY044 TaxID=2026089 RepID=UPI000B98067A|nr:GNAT family protein [Paenibacillus sp. XY044]OZB94191.1 GNAT family N-acetyltransferase [Paenibacillus sp. XY044]